MPTNIHAIARERLERLINHVSSSNDTDDRRMAVSLRALRDALPSEMTPAAELGLDRLIACMYHVRLSGL